MAPGSRNTVAVDVLGRFRVTIAGDEVPDDAWSGRRAAELVQLLALAGGHRMVRDQVIDALWPHLDTQAGGANLRKAAYHARQALHSPDAVVLRGGQVALFPTRSVVTDAARFDRLAGAALASGDPVVGAEAAAAYGGELLPDSLYEEWTQAERARLRSRYVAVLRASGQWERVVEVEPTDELAYRELMRAAMATGSRPAAIQWYGRLRTVLGRELGVAPSRETEALYDECVAGLVMTAPALVGRQVELARATAMLRAPPASRLGGLVVRGPAGIGKSAFCGQLARLAREEGWMVVAVEATQPSHPYAPVSTAVEGLVGDDWPVLDALGEPVRSVLAALTTLAGPAPPLDIPLGRHQVIGAFRRLLLAASGPRPVMMVVDDAHVVDEATVDLLLHLAVTGGPVLVVLAYRPEPAHPALDRGVARLVRAAHLTAIDLGPLEHDDAASLVVQAAPRALEEGLVGRIVQLAEGNPFATLELARGAASEAPERMVATVREAITARLCDLDDDAVAVLRRLALASDDLDSSTVVALTGSSEAEAFALLDLALDAGILIVSGTRYRFRHDLVRQALVEEIPPHQRLAVHRDAARRLASLGGAPAVIAWHWLAGGRPDEAVGWLLAAAREAMRLGAFADALGHLEQLLAHAGDNADALCLRAEALDALGDPRAVAAYHAAAEAVGELGSHDLRAKQALAQIKLGDPPGALRTLEGVVPRTVEGRLSEALTLSGAAALGYGDPALGTIKAAESRRLALQSGDAAALVVASWAQAAAAHARGELRDSVWADLRETHDLPHLAVRVFDGQLCVTQRLLYGAWPYPDVIAFADALAAEAVRLGAARGHAFAVTLRGEAELLAGQLDAAELDLTTGGRLHQAIGGATGEALALQRRAELAMYRGRSDEAVALLDEALDVARISGMGFHLLDRIYGTRVALAGDPSAALATLEDAEEAVRGALETCPGCRITFAVPAAIAAARAGDLARAAEYERAAEWLATVVMRLPAWHAALEEVRGHIALATGEEPAAAARFAAATAGFRAAGQPLDEARCADLATRGG